MMNNLWISVKGVGVREGIGFNEWALGSIFVKKGTNMRGVKWIFLVLCCSSI